MIMGDPLSVISGVVGVVAVGLHGLRLLVADIEAIKKAPEAIRSVESDIRAVERVFSSLESRIGGSDKVSQRFAESIKDFKVESTLATCNQACAEFHITIKKWMKNSTDGDTFWWDRVRVGLFGESRIQLFRSQLGTCKDTIIIALDTANL
jgi:hypothetical protein